MKLSLSLVAAATVTALVTGSALAGTITDPLAHAGTVTINLDGSISVAPPTGNYDGVEDVTYNVINNSPGVLNSLFLQGPGIFGLDGDGIDNYVDSNGANLFGATTFGSIRGTIDASDTGYGGYNNGAKNFFTGYVINGNQGTINFANGGVAGNGGTSFFSLEAPSTANGTVIISHGVPLPAAAWSGLALLAGAGLYARKRRA
jgi:LPXTG-motif cell wall-anchored protein